MEFYILGCLCRTIKLKRFLIWVFLRNLRNSNKQSLTLEVEVYHPQPTAHTTPIGWIYQFPHSVAIIRDTHLAGIVSHSHNNSCIQSFKGDYHIHFSFSHSQLDPHLLGKVKQWKNAFV